MMFYFSERISAARSFGINDIIIDPGFGFAKTLEQNYEVLQKLELFLNFRIANFSWNFKKINDL